MSDNDWAATPVRAKAAAEPDVNHVFSNFRNSRPAKSLSEAEARERNRRRGDRMQGVVVEVRKSRTPRQEADAPAPSIFQF